MQKASKSVEGTSPATVTLEAVTLRLPVAAIDAALEFYIGVQVNGIDAYFAELQARRVDATGPGNRDYGMRDFEVVDPDGNRIAFGEPVR